MSIWYLTGCLLLLMPVYSALWVVIAMAMIALFLYRRWPRPRMDDR